LIDRRYSAFALPAANKRRGATPAVQNVISTRVRRGFGIITISPKGGPVRIRTALLVCLGLMVFGLFILAQTSTRAPAQTSTRAPAAAAPRAPSFEYLGRLEAELGTRTVIENGPQGTRTIVQVLGGRFDGPRLKAS